METCDVAVIGAGIVGAACAYELASSGLRVVVVEPNAVAAGGTNQGYGNLAIRDDKPGLFALTRYGLSLWEELVEWLPQECEYRVCGTIMVASDQAQLNDAVRRSELFNREGIHTEILGSRQLAEAEPGLRADLAGGLYVADDACMRASCAAEFLSQLATNKGMQRVRQKAIAILDHEIQLEDGNILYAGNIVNAAGSDAATLNPELPVEYSKGHLLVVETQIKYLQHHISELVTHSADIDEQVGFEARQSENGEIWIGTSHQAADLKLSAQVEPRIVAMILRRALEMVPQIGHAKPLRSWTGLRVTTADGLPLIGKIAGREGMFVGVGHDDYGATTALATARLIADEILLRAPAIDPTPYLADRFKRTIS